MAVSIGKGFKQRQNGWRVRNDQMYWLPFSCVKISVVQKEGSKLDSTMLDPTGVPWNPRTSFIHGERTWLKASHRRGCS